MAIGGWKEKMRRYAKKTGELPINDAMRMELMIAMCPNAFKEVICLWLSLNKGAMWGRRAARLRQDPSEGVELEGADGDGRVRSGSQA